MTAPRTFALLCGIVALANGSCGEDARAPASGTGGGAGAPGGVSIGGGSGDGGSTASAGDPGEISGGLDAGRGAGAGDTPGCSAAGAAETTLEPVRLAFVFDVSASMGQLDKPYHDPKLKWEPVVAATEAFFTAPESKGIEASLTFFPLDADDDERCDATSYGKPDVPFTALPTDVFTQAITAITPHSKDAWRSGTPTLAAVSATLDFARAEAKKGSGYRYAVVLVSDGYPQGCDDDDIESVADVVRDASADDLPTYVIGVSNPKGGPDTVSNLNQVAEAGGTDPAFVIATGDPEKTKNDFLSAVRAIQTGAVSCAFDVPAPPAGLEFDSGLANVSVTSGTTTTAFTYDPECKSDRAWRYQPGDEDSPTRMVLCDGTCDAVKKDADAKLRVEFGCTRRDVIR